MSDVTHKDILGNVIGEGDSVVYPDHNRMRVGTVTKLNPKMINVVPVGSRHPDRKYPQELLVVDDPKITMYMLKYNK